MFKNKISYLYLIGILLFSNNTFAAQVRLDVSGILDELVLGGFSSNEFSASFLYETDTSLASAMLMDAPNDVSYVFNTAPYFGSAIVGNPLAPTYDVNFQGVEVGVGNNITVAMDDFPGVPAGLYDAFAALSRSPGAVLDGDGVLSTGIEIGLLFFANTNFLSNVNSIPNQPPSGTGVIGQFFILDFTNDSVNRAAIGNISSLTVTAVPLPAAVYFLFSGLIALFAVRKY